MTVADAEDAGGVMLAWEERDTVALYSQGVIQRLEFAVETPEVMDRGEAEGADDREAQGSDVGKGTPGHRGERRGGQKGEAGGEDAWVSGRTSLTFRHRQAFGKPIPYTQGHRARACRNLFGTRKICVVLKDKRGQTHETKEKRRRPTSVGSTKPHHGPSTSMAGPGVAGAMTTGVGHAAQGDTSPQEQ